jgi:RHS repeat-associated protein
MRFQLALRFAGQYFDLESNLNQNYFRSYDPKQGRYTQSDPIGLDGGWNKFAYANVAPTMFTDPTGLQVPGSWNTILRGIPSPIDAANTVVTNLEEIRRTGHRDFPGEGNSDMRHCVASCLTADQYGVALGRTAGTVNELQGLIRWDIPNLVDRITGDSPWAFQTADLAANEKGFSCSKNQSCPVNAGATTRESCIKCCSSK